MASRHDYNKLENEMRRHLKLLEAFRLDPSQVKIMERETQTGTFSTMFQCELTTQKWYQWPREPPTIVAVKKYRMEGNRTTRLREVVGIMRDLVTWSQLENKHILPLRGFHFDPTNHLHVSVVTTWQKNGNVLQYVVGKEKDGGEARVPELIRDIADGLAYLHSLNICHGDVKPQNFVVQDVTHLIPNVQEKEEVRALICDFTVSKSLDGGRTGLTTTYRKLTTEYASPEVMEDPSIRTFKSDVWSFGCLMYHLLSNSREGPYEGLNGPGVVYRAAKAGVLPAELENLPRSDFKDIIQSCWAYGPEQRPKMKQIQQAIHATIDGSFGKAMLKVRRDDGVAD